MRLPTPHAGRAGLTLLEVLVALAIFLLALGGISHLLSFAGERALEVQTRNQAARLCQSKLAEVLSGVLPLSTQGDTPFEEDPNYHWSLTAEQQGAIPNLWTITIKVTRDTSNGDPLENTITQMILDPSVIGSTQDVTPIAGSDQTTATASSSGSSSGSNGNAGAAAPAKAAAPVAAPAKAAAPAVSAKPASGGK